MSPRTSRSPRGARAGSAETLATLAERRDALVRAREDLGGIAPADALDATGEMLERLDARTALSAEHTVIGFFGATGSGKSSLMNTLVGEEISPAAVRRPTTRDPHAAVLDPAGADALLDWLEVADRHEVQGGPLHDALAQAAADGAGRAARAGRAGGASGTGPAAGMVLLDLPDLDSVQESHRDIAERMTGMVDVLVWVTDPQKYADRVLHRDFVEPFAGHDAVTLVLLNQIDTVREDERESVHASLEQIVRGDGLEHAPVLAVSAQTGAGLAEVRSRFAAVAQAREAIAMRRRADLREAATGLREAADPSGLPDRVPPAAERSLEDALGAAARIEPVAEAVGKAYRHRADARSGWPVVRWLRRVRPDPLGRLHLGADASRGGRGAEARSSLPVPDAATSARASEGLRGFADTVSREGSAPWRAAVRRSARSREDELPDALDQAVVGADLSRRTRGWWWPVLDVLQWLAMAAWVVGLGWLVLNAVLAFFQVPAPPMPMIRELWVPIPLPTALVVLGVGAGILLAVLGGALAALVSRLHAARARRLLRARVHEVAADLVVGPVQDRLDAARRSATDLAEAGGDAPPRRV
ncbi:50S ribosome-binding GTPase [Brachybacterium sp. MASK1Z-5]|uniref:50S ribosome-binding GTPase n=1 Tax=Brachybacterium halotolerans TaxID=2795215 RepID=A0ABS1BAV1_9MICO|nr:GTPase [Brachybacterium halotolerans]MBK0331287.1 50S ribosome-binding GTPase [Brachybacterium halotolerans]